ncbi:MAG: beta-N-acetylhexosaminidase [Bacteroidales bacterium]|nr:beta-N-acetylhexosaminidase [Bacteroidales bacterium]
MNLLKSLSIVALMSISSLAAAGQKSAVANFNVIPMPSSVEIDEKGHPFVIDKDTKIVWYADLEKEAKMLQGYIEDATGLKLPLSTEPQKGAITLAVNPTVKKGAEGYRMKVCGCGISIASQTTAGVFYGIQTLRKALPIGEKMKKVEVPAATIEDSPRFAYRGAHLDVCRHFFNADSVKIYIDMLAMHNINRFHWHISEDQGWRIEIKKYPRLTEVGGTRPATVIGHNSGKYDGKPHSGFFTQEQAREIVQYAADRHITVIPEIDLPGHMQAALAAYPELGCTGGPYHVWQKWGVSDEVLCAGNPHTLTFIKDVLDEITQIFPSQYIHIGGDECPKTRWKSCPKCQAKMAELGFTDGGKRKPEERMQGYIMQEAEHFLASKGRKVIGWDEILEGGLGPDVTIHSWRGIDGAVQAARQGHDAILSPTSHMYFDYYQSKDKDSEPDAIGGYLPEEKVYSFNPIPSELTADEAKHIIGVQANVWTEYIPTFKQVQYMALPRFAALCEVQWCAQDQRDYAQFLQRLPRLAALYRLCGYNYAKHVVK